MAKADKKDINERANQIDDAWKEEDETVEFKGHKHADLVALRATLAAGEQLSEDHRANARNQDQINEDGYVRLNAMLVDIRSGVSGHKDYGEDSPLYGSMGFVRKSERKSGLTRKEKKKGDK